MKRQIRIVWTQKDLDILINLYPNAQSLEVAKILKCSVSRVYNKAFSLGLKKSEKYLNSPLSGRLTAKDTRGFPTRFSKGHAPANKGKKWDEFMSSEGAENSLKTTFQNGHLPHNTKADGQISIRNDEGRQYKYIRISKGKWTPLHIYLWEKENGTVPAGMIVVFKDKNSMNCDLSNLEIITREENMSRNTFHRYPPELKLAIRKLNQLKNQINGKEQNSGSKRPSVRDNRVA
jgi:hypothetical protein